MANEKKIQSDALRVNLEQTRVTEPALPESHQKLLGLAGSAFGVKNRLQKFFWELHHPYSNDEQTVKLLRETFLNDLWFYIRHDEDCSGLTAIVEVFELMLRRNLTDMLHERVITTLLDVMGTLYKESLQLSHNGLERIIEASLQILEHQPEKPALLVCRASSFLKEVDEGLATDPRWKDRWFSLLKNALERNLDFWHRESEYENWVREWAFLTRTDLSFLESSLGENYFVGLKTKLESLKTWSDLMKMEDCTSVSDHFRDAVQQIGNSHDQTYYLLYLLKHPGMIHEQDTLLRDLNRVIQTIREEISDEEVIRFTDRLFEYFTRFKPTHTGRILDSIRALAKALFARDSVVCIEHFIDKVIQFGFIAPKQLSPHKTWQNEIDPNHIKCLRTWLEIIEYKPEYCLKLIAALVVNIRIKGLFISDTDLFQRDITELLNSRIEPAYQQIRELARLFPVYFSEIGAEGRLRDVTTQLDEFSSRQDKLIHYLRKQVHTESNNTHILLIEQIARFWYDGDPEILKEHVPADVAAELHLSGEWFDPIHRSIRDVCAKFGLTPEESLKLAPKRIQKFLVMIEKKNPVGRDTERLVKLMELHQLLEAKYTVNDYRIIEMLKQNPVMQHKAHRLENMLKKDNPDAALHLVFGMLQQLRKTILNPARMESTESIYHKRHIAAGIPSMYGRYGEPKFEALGLSFRLEVLAANLMQKVIDNINLRYISAWTLRRIIQVLSYFQMGFRLTGIVNEGFNANIAMLNDSLETTSFSIAQYVNLFQFLMRNVNQIIQTYCIRPFEKILWDTLLKEHYSGYSEQPDAEQTKELHGDAEKFYREVLSSVFLVSHLDNLISKILNTLNHMASAMEPEIVDGVMTFDPDLMTSSIREVNHALDSQIFLGSKGYFLKRLYAYRFPVPEGFILTTEMYRRRVAILRHPEISQEVAGLVRRRIAELETHTGKKFGDPTNLLLLSVRSGAAISLPGAMTTFLNVGLNDQIVEELSQQHNYGWTSWDCYRRFLQTWGMAYGIPRDDFDSVIIAFKQRYQVEEKMKFTNEQMRAIALAYKDLLFEHDVKVEEDPFRQLMEAIMVVMDSWSTPRAKIYRERLQIAPDWGTAVIIQQMVLGNINIDSGTGVVFTHDPAINEAGVNLYGDYTMCSQGEDVVAGLVHTLPISESQRLRSPQKSTLPPGKDMSLEKDFPEIYGELLKRSNELVYAHGFGHQEIEFTFESSRRNDLYVLQTRDHSWNRDDEIPVFKDTDMSKNILGTGIGISKGAMNGVVVFDEEDLRIFEKKCPNTNRILIRPDTVPDDIGMIFDCEGLLTARGGAASHAAVTAVRLGKTCVVNCRMLTVLEKEKRCVINGHEFRSGDRIAIDGRSGHIYKGHYSIGMAAPLGLP